MKKLIVLCFGYIFIQSAVAQNIAAPASKVFRATTEKINDLVHTRLDVKFDYQKSYLYGKEWVTLKPHFYATDSLTLDAKGMDIHKVAIVKGASMKALKYSYDNWQLRISLDKLYKGGEQYTVYIYYTSKTNEVKVEEKSLATRLFF